MTNPPDEQGPHLHKTLRWYDGFVLALPIATGIFISVGYVIGAIGAIPATVICVVVSVVALLQNTLFAEMPAMFPDKAGGVAMFATEAWKRYFTPVGPLAAFGYWCGWSLVLSLVGLTVGSLVQVQWFPSSTWTLFTLVGVNFGFPHVVSALSILACTAVNIAGIKLAVRFNQVIGAAFLVVLAVLSVGPFVSGQWHSVNLTSHIDGGWRTFVVWLYVTAWAIYGTELCAVFAPEYRDTNRDTSRALTSVALFMVGVYTLVPIATTGQLGEQVITKNPITFGVESVHRISGGLSGVITAVLCGALFLSMISSSADAGRALYGIASEGMSIKQLQRLNRRGMPSTALWLAMVVNLVLLVLVGNPVAILLASNLGYILAISLAVVSFLLLRKDRPHWPRPIRLGNAWPPIAAAIAVFNTVALVIGVLNPGLSHAGGVKEVLFGIGLLSIGVVLFVYRRVVQDQSRIELRDRSSECCDRSEDNRLPQPATGDLPRGARQAAHTSPARVEAQPASSVRQRPAVSRRAFVWLMHFMVIDEGKRGHIQQR